MAVYVDRLAQRGMRYRGQTVRSCHLLADTDEEPHTFAARLGMQRRWAHQGSALHYDLMAGKRALAVRLGAQEVSDGELVDLVRRKRGWE